MDFIGTWLKMSGSLMDRDFQENEGGNTLTKH